MERECCIRSGNGGGIRMTMALDTRSGMEWNEAPVADNDVVIQNVVLIVKNTSAWLLIFM